MNTKSRVLDLSPDKVMRLVKFRIAAASLNTAYSDRWNKLMCDIIDLAEHHPRPFMDAIKLYTASKGTSINHTIMHELGNTIDQAVRQIRYVPIEIIN